MIPYHLTNLALPTHASSHICKLSCTQASPSPHAGTRLRFYRNRTYDIRHPLMPGVGQSTTSGEPTRERRSQPHLPHQPPTAPSLVPRILPTLAVNKSRIRRSQSCQVQNCRRPKVPKVLRFKRSKSKGSRAFLKNLQVKRVLLSMLSRALGLKTP